MPPHDTTKPGSAIPRAEFRRSPRDGGAWYVIVYDATDRAFASDGPFDTKEEADEWADDMKAELRQVDHVR